ncbi:deoxyribose-phosphate aldolase [Salsuginibacillus halophilus]|uniref:Deoxyribose-phosphate aldolase n=1 Tax=Salsuginibacillus halophilus TaxID=517424 RepID=A0A2P8HFM4_9BACI|nr:deoxyribose-phosphate aldolase [Salsuginibacillus halophilus]PSL45029.1 deoxyribose-phosphate aldolase [Salsuginibacillus halophilus]
MSSTIAKTIDHTLLKPEATTADVVKLAEEAKMHEFASVCVNPIMADTALEKLEGTDVMVCAVVGFPLGATTTKMKQEETKELVAKGVEEIDMVLSIGCLKEGSDDYVRTDIQTVVDEARAGGAITKVIIETALLTDEEKKRACRLSLEAGAEFVKTSTGFAGGGATVEDVRLMKEAVGEQAEVKASGGIRDTQTALAMLEAGADRIGASASVAIAAGAES